VVFCEKSESESERGVVAGVGVMAGGDGGGGEGGGGVMAAGCDSYCLSGH